MSTERVLQSLKYTRMCKFVSAGRCCRGSACDFAHSVDELRPTPNLVSTRLCAQFSATGRCRYGRVCKFAHGSGELRDVPVEEGSERSVDLEGHRFSDRPRGGPASEPPDCGSLMERGARGARGRPGSVAASEDISYFNTPPGLGARPSLEMDAKRAALLRDTFWVTEPAADAVHSHSDVGAGSEASTSFSRLNSSLETDRSGLSGPLGLSLWSNEAVQRTSKVKVWL
ncbi:unnamed protein product [Durusdinium trenchii]|uniref:Uncharacterized protein n=2 Tax=Durusdinium trenchii TaxID=1381693 RepID=A0ABP0SPX6_9DINO